MKKVHTIGKLTWIDIEAPSKEEVRTLMEEYDIHPLIAEELITPSIRPRIDLHSKYIYLILHFPAIRHTHSLGGNQEIDFLIGKDILITTHYDSIDAIHKFSKELELNSLTEKDGIGDHAGFLFYFLIKKLYKSLEHELEHIEARLENIEENIFLGKEKEMVYSLSDVSRDLLNIKQGIDLHPEVLTSLEEISDSFFNKDFVHYVKMILGRHYRVRTIIERLWQDLHELRATNNSLLTTKQNEVMQIFTIMAFVTFPLSVIASIFGMNTSHMPLIDHPYGFWVLVGSMIALMLLFFAYFKYKKWL